jgi:hypothetical protein
MQNFNLIDINLRFFLKPKGKKVKNIVFTLVLIDQTYRRIDFRDLVRDLFGLFKTRIWLQQLNSPSPHATTKAS